MAAAAIHLYYIVLWNISSSPEQQNPQTELILRLFHPLYITLTIPTSFQLFLCPTSSFFPQGYSAEFYFVCMQFVQPASVSLICLPH